MKTMAQIIQETEDYYIRDNNHLGMAPGLGCRYYVGEGHCCAVGRCLVNPEEFVGYGFTVREDPTILDSLKKEYKGHPDEFWIYLQQLHDLGMYRVNGVNKYNNYSDTIKAKLKGLLDAQV